MYPKVNYFFTLLKKWRSRLIHASVKKNQMKRTLVCFVLQMRIWAWAQVQRVVPSWLSPVQESTPPSHKHAPYAAIALRGSTTAPRPAMAAKVSSADPLERIINIHAGTFMLQYFNDKLACNRPTCVLAATRSSCKTSYNVAKP